MQRPKRIKLVVRNIPKPKITQKVQANIRTVMNLAPISPIVFTQRLELDQMVNFLKESKDTKGFLVGFSHDILSQRACYRHLSVSANGKSPLHEDLVTFADAFGLPEKRWSKSMTTPVASHVYQIMRHKMH